MLGDGPQNPLLCQPEMLCVMLQGSPQGGFKTFCTIIRCVSFQGGSTIILTFESLFTEILGVTLDNSCQKKMMLQDALCNFHKTQK